MKQYKNNLPVEKETGKIMNDAGKNTKDARIGRRHNNMINALKSSVSKDVCKNFMAQLKEGRMLDSNEIGVLNNHLKDDYLNYMFA